MKIRLIALCAVVALLGTACGSRLSDDELSAAAGPVAGGPATPGGPGTTVPQGDGGPMFGSLDAPCGEAEDGAEPAAGGGDTVGVTADSIKIGVISDKAGVVKVPTASIEESVKAFVAYCNDLGGINGRQIELKTYDAKLVAGDVAAQSACNDGLLALVGTGVVGDDKMAQVLVDCDLVNVAAYTATAKAAQADLTVVPLPNPSSLFNSAPGQWMAEQHPEAVKKAAIIASDLAVATVQGDRIVAAYEGNAGFDFAYEKAVAYPATSYSGNVAEMRNAGVEYVTMVSATSETNKVLKDMRTAGFEPVIDLGQQYYDAELLEEPGAEGAYVQTNTYPFEEADQVPAMQQFLDEYDKVGTEIAPTSLGVQAFSAGLLFATAAKAAGGDLNRGTLYEELKKITEWDGGGLHFTTSPGENRGAPCFLYMKVEGGKFVREFPEEPGTFECVDESAVFDLKNDYGGGATKR